MKYCSEKIPVRERDLITSQEAEKLESLFKVFSNRNRLRLLHAIAREERICVGEIARVTGMSQQAVSNHLKILLAMGLVTSEREGNFTYIGIKDPCIYILIERGLCMLEESGEISYGG